MRAPDVGDLVVYVPDVELFGTTGPQHELAQEMGACVYLGLDAETDNVVVMTVSPSSSSRRVNRLLHFSHAARFDVIQGMAEALG